MNTKWKVIISVMLLITAICAIFVILVQRQHDDKVAAIVEGKHESAALLADTLLSQLSQGYKRRIIAFTNPDASPSRELMIRAFANRDREKLLQLSKPLFTVLEKENPNFKSLGWILPDNHVFLRLKYPEKFGHDISKVRPDIAAVNRDKHQHSGFDVGIKSMQYRVVQPVFYHGEYLGAVQFGFNASVVFDVLQSKLNSIAGMAILNEEYDLIQESMVPKVKSRTHTIRSSDVTMFEAIKDQLDWDRELQRVELKGRAHVIVNVLPVVNFQKEKQGVFFVALDISEELAQKRKLIITVLIISGVLLIFSFFILYFSYGSLIQKIINLNQSLEKNNLELEDRVHERTTKIKESEEKLSLVIEGANLGYWDWNFQTDGLTVNDRWLEILGLEREKFRGKFSDWLEHLHPEDRLRIEPVISEHIETHRCYVVNFRMRHKDGHWVWIQGSGAGVEYDPVTDKPIRACGTHQDITEQKRLEEELVQTHKMEAVGTLAGGIAHDFNNILSAILGFSQLAKQDLPEGSSAGKDIDEIIMSSRRAADLVQQILTFSRKSEHDLQSLNPHLIINEVLRMLHSSLPSTVIIHEDIDKECGKICADPTNIHQIMMNLCTNALHAMEEEKGTLTVKLYRREIAAEEIMQESGVPAGPFVVLSVSDTGHGMDEVTKERIFDPFFTTKETGKGTGMGLAVIHGIIQAYKGFIRIDSTPGEGSTFTVYFPALQEEAFSHKESASEESEKEESLPTTGNERILVVDDELLLVKIHKKQLERCGYTVTGTTDSRDALEKIRAQPEQFDLLITDQTMPNLSGGELAEAVQGIRPELPIILCTGHSDIISKKEALALGIKKYVTKPIKDDELFLAIREVLDEK